MFLIFLRVYYLREAVHKFDELNIASETTKHFEIVRHLALKRRVNYNIVYIKLNYKVCRKNRFKEALVIFVNGGVTDIFMF